MKHLNFFIQLGEIRTQTLATIKNILENDPFKRFSLVDPNNIYGWAYHNGKNDKMGWIFPQGVELKDGDVWVYGGQGCKISANDLEVYCLVDLLRKLEYLTD